MIDAQVLSSASAPVGGDPRDRVRHALVCARHLARHLDSRGMAGRRRIGLHREELVVRSDGTPLIRSTPLDNLSLATYRDLNGAAQDAPDQRRPAPGGVHGRRARETRLLFRPARLGAEAQGFRQ